MKNDKWDMTLVLGDLAVKGLSLQHPLSTQLER